MDTTTTDGGPQGQPQDSAAVTTEGHNADQVITTDSNGTPTMEPVTSQSEEANDEAVAEESVPTETEETQAPADVPSEDEFTKFAKAKGFDPAAVTASERKALEMAQNAEKRMHEATQKARELETTVTSQAPIDYTGDPNIDSLAQQVNSLLIKNNVNDFFSNTPEAREYESKMAEIVTQRPHLQNDLDALYALARTDPSRESQLRQEGGRQALTQLAQKQSAIPPGANATNSGVYESQAITSGNVWQQIDSHDQEWFEKNYSAINKAISGK